MSGVTAPAPWRIAFDNARDPYTARNALGAEVIDGGGNVSNSGTPADNQIAVWTGATAIEGSSTFTFDGLTLRTPGLRGSNGTASATAGDVGEFIQANKTTSSGSLTAAAIGTYHSTSLTAGDWDVWVHSTVICAAGGFTVFEFELTTGASLSGSNLAYVATSLPTASATQTIDIQPVRFLLTSTTTINLNYRAGTTGASISNAYIAARRRR